MFAAILGGSQLAGCRADEAEAVVSKCDAPLRMRAEEMARAGDKGPIEVLGSTHGAIDDARRRKLTEAGAELGQVTEELFTARIPADRLGRVARLDFVKSLQMSQKREPLSP